MGDISSNILQKSQSFLNQRVDLRDAKNISWHMFPVEVPHITPVIAKRALC